MSSFLIKKSVYILAFLVFTNPYPSFLSKTPINFSLFLFFISKTSPSSFPFCLLWPTKTTTLSPLKALFSLLGSTIMSSSVWSLTTYPLPEAVISKIPSTVLFWLLFREYFPLSGERSLFFFIILEIVFIISFRVFVSLTFSAAEICL